LEEKIYEITTRNPDKRVLLHLYQVATLLSLAAERALEKAGATPEQLAVLLVEKVNPQPTTPAVVAKALALRNQSVAGQLNRMEREGFVRRIPKRRGKPYTDVVATPWGEALRNKAEPLLWAMASRVPEGMEAADKRVLVAALGHLRDNLLDELRMDVVAPPWSP
jgi:DNA-binding MarR family transcriptional regulator